MATTLYLKTNSFRGIGPTETNSSALSPLLTSYRPATLPSFMVMDETQASFPELLIGGTNQLFYDYSNFVFLGVWATHAITADATISDNFELIMNMWEQADIRYSTKDSVHSYWITYSVNLYPYINMYTYDNELGKRDTIKNGFVSPEATFSSQYTTRTVAPDDSVILSSGDKLVMELWAYHNVPECYGYWWETTSLGPQTRINFPTLDMDFGTYSSNRLGTKYTVRANAGASALLLKYDFAMCRTSVSPRYYIFGHDYLDWYYETASPGRGQASLMVRSRCENGFDDDYYQTDYSKKWVIDGPSLHKCFPIDDFEYYTDSAGFGGVWSVSDYTHSFKAVKTFSAGQTLSDYNMLTFYAKSNNPTMIFIRMSDSYGNVTPDHSFFVTDRWERYEATISWGSTLQYYFKGFEIESSYSGNVVVDDIFLLKYGTATENYDWTELNLAKMDMSKEMRFSTFKIPFSKKEVIQFHGEKNGEGNLNLFSPNMEQTEFVSELMRFQEPIYFRYRNRGIPIVLRDVSKTIRNVATSSIQHSIGLPYYEIYDYTLY